MSLNAEIPLDIRNAMRDCILSIFWPKKDIVEFLRSVGCPAEIIQQPDNETSRRIIITNTFARLTARKDHGYTIFQCMIDRLSNWTYFDSYYFEKQQKLNKEDALQKIGFLKQAIHQRNTEIRHRREVSQKSSQAADKKEKNQSLYKQFIDIYGDKHSPQERGRLFEFFLRELFNQQSMHLEASFRLVGEEIDGTFKFEGENYLVEAKWEDAHTSTQKLYIFAQKTSGKLYGRGVFISVHAFSKEAIRALVHGKHIQTILIDGEDISNVLEERITLEKLLDYKIKAAQTRGEVYVCSIRKTQKV